MKNKHICRSLLMGGLALLLGACNNESENDLLAEKVYFESSEYQVTMKEEKDVMDVNITSRLSNLLSSDVNVSYEVAEESLVKEYNAKHGTGYLPFNAQNAKINTPQAVIEAGATHAKPVVLTLSGLNSLEAGKSYILPVRVKSSSVPTVAGEDIEYVILAKPILINKVGTFTSHYISVKFPAGTFFKSFTYEALVYSSGWGSNNTIMGCEGIMILRVGDEGGGISRGILQIAGNQHYESPDKLPANQWCHVAITYDQPSGKTVLYLNGAKWAESTWNIAGFDPNKDVGFNIGKLAGFPWGERPFRGYMSELRVWSVARTEKQIKQFMLGVDPKSDGLELYYKLDGSEKVEGNIIKDAAKNLDGKTNGINITTLDEPISIK